MPPIEAVVHRNRGLRATYVDIAACQHTLSQNEWHLQAVLETPSQSNFMACTIIACQAQQTAHARIHVVAMLQYTLGRPAHDRLQMIITQEGSTQLHQPLVGVTAAC